MKHKQSLLSSDSGFTILELLVASTLGLIMLALTLSTTFNSRDSYSFDLARTRLNQNLRSAFDIINSEVRQAGERLPQAFPAIEIINGASGAPDTLILRRNLLDEVLTVCADISGSTSTPNIALTSSVAGAPPACVYGSQTTNYNAWKSFRENSEGDVAKAYIFDLAAEQGEFFIYDSEADITASSTQTIHNQASDFDHNYSSSSSAVYMLAEWKFQLSSQAGEEDLLILTENEDEDQVKRIVFGVSNIQFRAILQDGTVLDSFGAANDWTELQAIEVTISGTDSFRNRTIESSLTTRLFPRNVMSN